MMRILLVLVAIPGIFLFGYLVFRLLARIGATSTLPKQRDENARDMAYGAMLAGAVTASWSGVSFLGLQPVDIAIGLATASFSYCLITKRAALNVPTFVLGFSIMTVLIAGIHTAVRPSVDIYALTLSRAISGSSITTNGQFPLAIQWGVAFALLPILTTWVCAGQERQVTVFAAAWVSGASLSGLVAILDYSGLTNISYSLIGTLAETTSGRQAGLTSQANNLGVSCAMAVPIAIHLLRRHRVLGILALACLLGGVVCSGSRAAQGATGLALLMSLLLLKPSKKQLAALVGAATLLLAGALIIFGTKVAGQQSLFRFTSEQGASDLGRRLLLDEAVENFQTNPLVGHGLQELSASHNILVMLLAAGGLALCVAFVWYIVAAFTMKVDSASRVWAMAGRISLLVWLAAAMYSNQLTDRYLYLPVALLLALHAVRSVATEGVNVSDATSASGLRAKLNYRARSPEERGIRRNT